MLSLPSRSVGFGLGIGALAGGFVGFLYGEELAIAAFGSIGLIAGGAAGSAVAWLMAGRR